MKGQSRLIATVVVVAVLLVVAGFFTFQATQTERQTGEQAQGTIQNAMDTVARLFGRTDTGERPFTPSEDEDRAEEAGFSPPIGACRAVMYSESGLTGSKVVVSDVSTAVGFKPRSVQVKDGCWANFSSSPGYVGGQHLVLSDSHYDSSSGLSFDVGSVQVAGSVCKAWLYPEEDFAGEPTVFFGQEPEHDGEVGSVEVAGQGCSVELYEDADFNLLSEGASGRMMTVGGNSSSLDFDERAVSVKLGGGDKCYASLFEDELFEGGKMVVLQTSTDLEAASNAQSVGVKGGGSCKAMLYPETGMEGGAVEVTGEQDISMDAVGSVDVGGEPGGTGDEVDEGPMEEKYYDTSTYTYNEERDYTEVDLAGGVYNFMINTSYTSTSGWTNCGTVGSSAPHVDQGDAAIDTFCSREGFGGAVPASENPCYVEEAGDSSATVYEWNNDLEEEDARYIGREVAESESPITMKKLKCGGNPPGEGCWDQGGRCVFEGTCGGETSSSDCAPGRVCCGGG